MNINIISVGKMREKFMKSGVEEFLKRLQVYTSVNIIEIAAEDLKHDVNRAKEIEAEKILNKISPQACVIVMEIDGKQLTSEKFADKIKEINSGGFNQIVFVIGGAFGLTDSVKNRADFLLSLSKMTFPHQMARLILVEQIYRAFRIINNEPYHK